MFSLRMVCDWPATGWIKHSYEIFYSTVIGGYPKIIEQGINEDYLPLWMQSAGYNTYYTGKLWNHHHVENYDKPYAKGFNSSDFLLDPYTYEYYHARMSRDGMPPVSYEGQYSPDVVAEKAYGLLHEATSHEEPWMLTVAPPASHGNIRLNYGQRWESDAPKYAERHAHLFKEYKIPRDANFNPVKVRKIRGLSEEELTSENSKVASHGSRICPS